MNSDHPATPCQDEPVGQQLVNAKLGFSKISIDTAVFAVVMAIVWETSWLAPAAFGRPCWAAMEHERPPDDLVCLRTVILLV